MSKRAAIRIILVLSGFLWLWLDVELPFESDFLLIIHCHVQKAGQMVQLDMFVDFVVSTVGIVSRDLFVSSQTMFEQAEVPVWEIGMLKSLRSGG